MRELGSSHLHHRSPLHLLRQLPATTREPPGHQRQVLHPAAAKSPSNFAPKGAVARGLYPQHGEGPAQQRQALGGDVGGRKSLPHIPEDRLHEAAVVAMQPPRLHLEDPMCSCLVISTHHGIVPF